MRLLFTLLALSGSLLSCSSPPTAVSQVAPVPAGPNTAKATKLVARFDKLTREEQRQLYRYGKDAFEPLLAEVKARLQANAGKKADLGFYSKFDDLVMMLGELMPPEQTSRVLALVQPPAKVAADPRSVVLLWLTRHGDDHVLAPLYVEIVRHPSKDEEGDYSYEHMGGIAYSARLLGGAALGFLARSNDPVALKFFVDALKDASQPGLQSVAFACLPDKGPEGIAAVRAARSSDPKVAGHWPPAIPTSSVTAAESGRRGRVQLHASKQANGVKWGLLSPGIAGPDDLWIARQRGNEWVDFRYCAPGFYESRAERRKDAEKELPPTLLRKDLWFTSFVGNAGIALDTDKDGLTDKLEARWGTDPTKADTDGDGLSDAEDKNPMARSSKSDEAKVCGRAIEGLLKFHGAPPWPYVVVLPDKVEPFEVVDVEGRVLMVPQPKTRRREGYASQSISLGPAMAGFDDKPLSETPFNNSGRPLILWNSDHTRAKLQVVGGIDQAGYDVELKKVDGDWFVVKIVMAWVA